MNLGVAFGADQLKIGWVISSPVFDLDDVMHLQAHRRPQSLEVFLSAKALPAISAHPLRQEMLEALVRFALGLAVFSWLRDPKEALMGAAD